MFLVFDVHRRSVSAVEKQKQTIRLWTKLILLTATGALIYLNYSNFVRSVDGEGYFGGWPLHAYSYFPKLEYPHRFEAREFLVDATITLSILFLVYKIGAGIETLAERKTPREPYWPRFHLSTLLVLMFVLALVLLPLNLAPHALGDDGYIGYNGFYVRYGWPMPGYASLDDGRARILYPHIVIDAAIAVILLYLVYRMSEYRIATRRSARE